MGEDLLLIQLIGSKDAFVLQNCHSVKIPDLPFYDVVASLSTDAMFSLKS